MARTSEKTRTIKSVIQRVKLSPGSVIFVINLPSSAFYPWCRPKRKRMKTTVAMASDDKVTSNDATPLQNLNKDGQKFLTYFFSSFSVTLTALTQRHHHQHPTEGDLSSQVDSPPILNCNAKAIDGRKKEYTYKERTSVS